VSAPERVVPFQEPGEQEIWLPAHDRWAKLYEVSSLGRVRSLDRVTPGGLKRRGRMLKQFVGPSGYLTIDLVDGFHERWPVHQLVARVFIGPRPEGQCTRHGPNGKMDNRLSQICYGTKAEDIQDKFRDQTSPRGEKQWKHKLTWEIVADIRRRYAAGEKQADLAAEFGVEPSGISQIVNGKTWRPWDGSGVEIPPTRRQRVRAETVRLHARYVAGESLEVLAEEAGCSRDTLSMRFLRLRKRGHGAGHGAGDGEMPLTA
jgi:NUMOD4 motif